MTSLIITVKEFVFNRFQPKLNRFKFKKKIYRYISQFSIEMFVNLTMNIYLKYNYLNLNIEQ